MNQSPNNKAISVLNEDIEQIFFSSSNSRLYFQRSMSWIVLGLLATALVVRGQETCLSGEEDPYLMFGTKTAYTFVTSGKTNNRVQDVLGEFLRKERKKE